MTLNEPIKDGAPIIYTKRSEGVRPEHDIRTDRFDIAIDAMDKTAKSYAARREAKPEMKVEKGGASEGSEGSESGSEKAS